MFCNSDTSRVRRLAIIWPGMDFESHISMKDKKHKQEGLKEQVHGEFETSVGNDFNVVREETPVTKNKDTDREEPLNQLPGDDDAVKNDNSTEDEAPKMNAEEKSR
jgi:hypothetical protein